MILEFDLLPQFQRPAIYLTAVKREVPALIDTGALVPVFMGNESMLSSFNAKLVKRGTSFGGFGGLTTGNLYHIDLNFGKFKFESVPIVAVQNSNMPFVFILSAVMFSDFAYTIDNIKHKLIVDTKDVIASSNLRYKTKSGAWIVLSNS